MSDFTNIVDTAVGQVTDKLAYLTNQAGSFSAQLSGAIHTLAAAANVELPGTPPSLTAPSFSSPNVNASISTGGEPGNYTQGTFAGNFAPVEAGDGSGFDMPAIPAPIAINVSPPPTLNMPAKPVGPGGVPDLAMPDKPVLTLPEMEALDKLTLPTFVAPTLPTFSGEMPTVDFAPPNPTINWSEPTYATERLDEIQGQVSTWLKGGTGLPKPVEEALFNRARERNSAEVKRGVEEAFDTWASRNFTMPPGMLVKQVNAAQEVGAAKTAELNRDILIEAAKWEIENIRNAVQQGIALEGLKMNFHENLAKRTFEVAKYTAEAQMSLFNAFIGLYNAKVNAFQVHATIFKARIEAALTEVQVFKTQVDAMVAAGQLNQQKVEVFKAKVQALLSSAELYKAEVEGTKAQADIIKTRFDVYRSEIQAFAEEVGAEKVKFDAYDSQVKAEASKAGIYESQVRAFAAGVQAQVAGAEVSSKNAMVKIEGIRAGATKLMAEAQAFSANASAQAGALQAHAAAYSARMDAEKARAQASVAAAESQWRSADLAVRTNIAFSEMAVKQYEASQTIAIQKAQVGVEAAKGMAQATAQATAGAMAAINVSASIGASGNSSQSSNWSESNSTSNSTSTSHNYNY
jgi:hypothetical protein